MTIYAQITDGTITRTTGGFTEPGYGEDGEWHDFSDPAERNAYLTEHGWHVATEVDRPADTATTTHDLTYALVDGQPTQVWTAREWTPEELAARTAAANEATLHEQVAAQVAVLTDSLATIKATRAAKKATIGDTADTTSATLRGLLSMSNTTIAGGANIKALVRLVIDGVQADRDTDRALVDAQRALIRISRLVARNLDSADSGTPDTNA